LFLADPSAAIPSQSAGQIASRAEIPMSEGFQDGSASGCAIENALTIAIGTAGASLGIADSLDRRGWLCVSDSGTFLPFPAPEWQGEQEIKHECDPLHREKVKRPRPEVVDE
jgi:hypothetical protein